MDDHPDAWLTLTEAATRTGYTREAIRQRIRRRKLPASKGNDGQVTLRADLMARMDRLGDQLGAIRDDIAVNMGAVEQVRRAERSTREQMQLIEDAMSGLVRQLRQLRARMDDMDGKGGPPA